MIRLEIKKFNKILCKLIGHQEEIIEDRQLDKDVIVSDDLKVKDFGFPIYIHNFICKRCKTTWSSYPDIPGSNNGRYKVHYL